MTNTVVEELRDKARKAYQNCDFTTSESIYSRGIEGGFCGDQLSIFYFNRALCRYKQENWADAEADVICAIRLDNNYSKAYLLKSRLEKRKESFNGALIDNVKSVLTNMESLESAEHLSQLLQNVLKKLFQNTKIKIAAWTFNTLEELQTIINNYDNNEDYSLPIKSRRDTLLIFWNQASNFLNTASQRLNSLTSLSNIYIIQMWIYNKLSAVFRQTEEYPISCGSALNALFWHKKLKQVAEMAKEDGKT
jgi:hypothetical protein